MNSSTGDERTVARPPTIHWCAGESCCDPQWEQAYQDFETPEEEVQKFLQRYRLLGAAAWPLDSEIVDLFCGRGNSLVALSRLGFTNLAGVDLSPELLAQYRGPVQTYVGDCRDLKFENESKDVVVIQGGLHHLPELPDDVNAVLGEVQRILRPEGRFVLVEPWLTPFLRVVHAACAVRPLRRVWNKLDAVARMNECEKTTYYRWLSHPEDVLTLLQHRFQLGVQLIGWGKLMLVATKR